MIIDERGMVFLKQFGFEIDFKGAAFVLLLAIGLACLYILKTFHIITPNLVEVGTLSILFLVNLFYFHHL
jgi:hypothetical protein